MGGQWKKCWEKAEKPQEMNMITDPLSTSGTVELELNPRSKASEAASPHLEQLMGVCYKAAHTHCLEIPSYVLARALTTCKDHYMMNVTDLQHCPPPLVAVKGESYHTRSGIMRFCYSKCSP